MSLQFLSLMVRRACQRLQPLETGCCAGHVGSRTCDHVPEDPAQSASVLRQVRRAGVHVNYAETVLPMRDGLPKLKDFPAEFGGSGEAIAE